MDRQDIKTLVDKWWDIYNDETLDYKAEGEGDLADAEKLIPMAGVVRYVPAPSAA